MIDHSLKRKFYGACYRLTNIYVYNIYNYYLVRALSRRNYIANNLQNFHIEICFYALCNTPVVPFKRMHLIQCTLYVYIYICISIYMYLYLSLERAIKYRYMLDNVIFIPSNKICIHSRMKLFFGKTKENYYSTKQIVHANAIFGTSS